MAAKTCDITYCETVNNNSNKLFNRRTSTIGVDKYRESTLCSVTVSLTKSSM